MKKRVPALFLAILLIVISFIFDKQIVIFIGGLRNIVLDYVFIGLTFATSAIIIFFFLTTIFLWNENKRRWILPLLISFLLSVSISFIIKILIQRQRPFEVGLVSVFSVVFYFMKANFNTWNFSFPSFQAILIFSALPILNKSFKKLKYFWLVFACLSAFSRVYFGVHYLSDVLTGAIIGFLIGYFAVFIEEKYSLGLKIMKAFS